MKASFAQQSIVATPSVIHMKYAQYRTRNCSSWFNYHTEICQAIYVCG